MKRVLFFLDSFMIGGTHRQILNTIKEINRTKIYPVVCTHMRAEGGLKESYIELGVPIYDLKRRRKSDLGVIPRLARVLREEKIDTVVLAEPQNMFYLRFARLLVRQKLRQIGLLVALGIWLGHTNRFLHPLDRLLAFWLICSSDVVIANSEAVRDYYGNFARVCHKKVHVAYNPIPKVLATKEHSKDIRKRIGIPLEAFVVVMVARLDPWKDFGTLLEAAAQVVLRLPHARFAIVGEGPERVRIEEKIRLLTLSSQVILLGERKDVFDIVSAADVCVLSTKGEGFSNALSECMALGKPVIATRVGGNPETVGPDGVAGFLVAPRDPIQLADYLVALAGNPTLRGQMGIAARERIHSICDMAKNVRTYERLILGEE